MGALRIALAFSVLMAHSANPGVLIGFGGENAVEGFYLVSGFYIAAILDKTYKNKRSFYLNRALRIYPMYFIVCGFVLVLRIPMQNGLAELFDFPFKTLIIPTFANLTLFGGDLVMFLQVNENIIQFGNFLNSTPPLYQLLLVPQSWSLALELTFYLLAPFLVRLKTFQIASICVAMVALRTFCYALGLSSDPWTYRFFPFELPLFLFGIILFRLKSNNIQFQLKYSSQLAIVLIAFFASGILIHFISIPRIATLLLTILVTSLLILNSYQPKIDKKIGEYSYPIYISHLLIFWWTHVLLFHFEFLDPLASRNWLLTLVNVLLTVGFSGVLLLSTAKVERLRDRIRSNGRRT